MLCIGLLLLIFVRLLLWFVYRFAAVYDLVMLWICLVFGIRFDLFDLYF